MEETIVEINKSKSYILPLLDEFVKFPVVPDIINTYLYMGNQSSTQRPTLHVLYNKHVLGYGFFGTFLEALNEFPYWIGRTEVREGLFLSFFIPDDIIRDYQAFVEGRYSKMSKRSKDQILVFLYNNYPGLNKEIDQIRGVLYKKDYLRRVWEESLGVKIPKDNELSSKINIKQETYE